MKLYVEVAYNVEGEGRLMGISLEKSISIRSVLNQHGIHFDSEMVGIRGQLVSVEQLVNDQDRIEVYDCLLVDPRKKRQLLVQSRAKKNKS